MAIKAESVAFKQLFLSAKERAQIDALKQEHTLRPVTKQNIRTKKKHSINGEIYKKQGIEQWKLIDVFHKNIPLKNNRTTKE